MSTPNFQFATVDEAAEEFRQGRPIVLVDDEDRENEGDITMAAEKVTPETINFMAKYGRGLICVTLTEDRCDELNLPLMTTVNTAVFAPMPKARTAMAVRANKGFRENVRIANPISPIISSIQDQIIRGLSGRLPTGGRLLNRLLGS